MSGEFGPEFDRAQAAYDAKEPPEDWDCETQGHQWKRGRSTWINGEYVVEFKCRICGKLDVI